MGKHRALHPIPNGHLRDSRLDRKQVLSVRVVANSYDLRDLLVGLRNRPATRLTETSVNLIVYRWKSGQTNPLAVPLRRIEKVLKMGKRQALDALMYPGLGTLAPQSKAAQHQIADAADVAQAPVQDTVLKAPPQTHFQAQALLRKREALGISGQDMAKLPRASLNSVYRWESGQMRPRAATQLARIAEVLKMDKRQALDALGQV